MQGGRDRARGTSTAATSPVAKSPSFARRPGQPGESSATWLATLTSATWSRCKTRWTSQRLDSRRYQRPPPVSAARRRGPGGARGRRIRCCGDRPRDGHRAGGNCLDALRTQVPADQTRRPGGRPRTAVQRAEHSIRGRSGRVARLAGAPRRCVGGGWRSRVGEWRRFRGCPDRVQGAEDRLGDSRGAECGLHLRCGHATAPARRTATGGIRGRSRAAVRTGGVSLRRRMAWSGARSKAKEKGEKIHPVGR